MKKEKANKGKNIVRMKALWSCNRYLVTRELWKSMFVPAITYANAIVTPNADVMRKLDTTQRAVARHALQCRFTCATQFVDGEFGATSFWAWEAQAKCTYETRLKFLEHKRTDNWAATMLRMKVAENVKSRWDTRTKYLKRKYDISVVITDTSSLSKLYKQAKRKITEKAETSWRAEMERKSSLAVYNRGKQEYGLSQIIYTNTKASGLLADCRAGMLNTKILRAKYEDMQNLTCRTCGEEEETMEHVVLLCEGLGRRSVDISCALGLTENIMWKELNETKRRLAVWDNQQQ
jgi:hypothetical protein